jgi:PAS domain S-box-containing protein
MSVLQELMQPAGLAGIGVGLVLAALPVAAGFASLARARRKWRLQRAASATEIRRDHAIVEATVEGVFELDNEGTVRYANPAAVRILGYELDEIIGKDYRSFILATDGRTPARHAADTLQKTRYTTDIMRGVGALLCRKDGERRPVEYRVVPVSEGGVTIGTAITFSDVTERVRTDSLLRDMQTTARVGGWEYDLESRKLTLTDAIYAILGLSYGQPLGMEQVIDYCHDDDRERLLAAAAQVSATGRRADLEVRTSNAQRREVWLRVIIKADRPDGKTLRLYGTLQDITGRVLAERQVRETRDFYELTLNAMPTLVAYINSERVITYANRSLTEWSGRRIEQVVGSSLSRAVGTDIYLEVGPDVEAALRGERRARTYSGLINGMHRDVQLYFVPQIDPQGAVRGFFSILNDITELKRLESRVLQGQKMEAIGQLTGGIAHDFNNLLGVVIGNLQLLERTITDSPQQARKIHTAMRAAIRGAELTRRLLAFARRQIYAPEVIDLNRLLRGLAELMQRSLGESVEVRLQLSEDLSHTRIDPGQLENAILNLAINARDAMPEGGRLTVESGNIHLDREFCSMHPPLEPGEHVVISVTDTGTGIAPEVLARVFEPFFTTKESGKGSGLGLAMVHGFIEQSGGATTIASEPGRGTVVRLYLPACEEERAAHDDTIIRKSAPRGSETILVVEDDADLRETVVTTLSHLGYKALAAPNAAAALRILSSEEAIDLLFTDVMMPGGTLGPALAERARQMRPDIDVLFTTGYAESSLMESSGLSSAEVIPKPYRSEDLALRIRHLLDREVRVA